MVTKDFMTSEVCVCSCVCLFVCAAGKQLPAAAGMMYPSPMIPQYPFGMLVSCEPSRSSY